MNRTAILILVTLASAPANARWSDALPMVDSADISMMKNAARVRMTDEPIGSVLEWSNKKSGSKGTVKLLDRFQRNGKECRTNRHVVTTRSEPTKQFVITICQAVDSSWQPSKPRQKRKPK